MKVFVSDVFYGPGGRRRITALLQWGGQESLNPKDVGVLTIDSIVLSVQTINTTQQAFPIGSVPTQLGSQNPGGGNYFYRGGGIGSSITLRWTSGSTGTRSGITQRIGTLSTGTKTAHAWIVGQTA